MLKNILEFSKWFQIFGDGEGLKIRVNLKNQFIFSFFLGYIFLGATLEGGTCQKSGLELPIIQCI